MQDSRTDFKDIFLFLLRWIWLLFLGLLLGAGLSLIVSVNMEPVYQASTKVLVTRTSQFQSPDFTAYLSDLQLPQTYLQLLTTQPVLNLASERIGVPIDPNDIKAQVIRDTQIIEIQVENNDAHSAVLIANSLVEVLIEQNEFIQSSRYDSMEESLMSQKTQIEAEIRSLQSQIEQASTKSLGEKKTWMETQIATLQEEESSIRQAIAALGEAKSPEEKLLLDQKTSALEQVQTLLSLYQENYNSLLLMYGNPSPSVGDTLNSQLTLLTTTRTLYQQFYITVLKDLETVRLARLQNTPSVVHIERATMPEDPVRPRILINTIFGGLAGLVVVMAVLFFREIFDDTLKNPKTVEQTLGVPVIGLVPEIQPKEKHAKEIHALKQPRAPISEAFRSLRTNLEFAISQKPIHTLLITSPQSSEGKTTIAVNLTAVLTQADKRVALLDADLRCPQIEDFLGLSNDVGLSDLLNNNTHIETIACSQPDLPNAMIISSGALPPNPAELLGSEKMSKSLRDLRHLVDVIVIDSPPLFVADAQVLASKVDAVLLVIQSGKTRVEPAQRSIEILKRAHVRVVGVVMNRVPRNDSYFRESYRYFIPYARANGDFGERRLDES